MPKRRLRAIERSGFHAVEREVGLDLRLVEVVARRAHFLAVVAPVPWRELEIVTARPRLGDERIALDGCLRAGGRPDARQQLGDRGRRSSHPVDQRELGVRRVAMEVRELVSQRQDLADDGPVVAGPIVLATANPREERLFAQVAAVRVREEGHDQRTRQRNRPCVVNSALAGRCLRGGTHVVRQTREVGLVAKHQQPLLLVGQHVLAERGRQCRQPLLDLRQAAARVRRKPGPCEHEIEPGPLDEALRLRSRVECVALRVHGVDAREEPRIHSDRRLMCKKPRDELALDGLQRRRRARRGEVEEHRADALQRAPAAVERDDRVFERGWRRRVRDGANLLVCSTRAASSAGATCSTRIDAKGGRPNGSSQRARSGLARASFTACVSFDTIRSR